MVLHSTQTDGQEMDMDVGFNFDDSLSFDSSLDDTMSVISTPSEIAGSDFSGADSDLDSDIGSVMSDVESLDLGLDLGDIDTELTAEALQANTQVATKVGQLLHALKASETKGALFSSVAYFSSIFATLFITQIFRKKELLVSSTCQHDYYVVQECNTGSASRLSYNN